jgi:hypothetical protein
MDFPKELYQPKTLLTLGGASVAVVVVCGVVGYVFNFNPKWLGLLVSLGIAFVGLTAIGPDFHARRAAYITAAVVNGALIYSQAVGLNALNNAVPSGDAKQAALVPGSAVWWTPADQQAAAEAMAASANEAWQAAEAAAEKVQSLSTQAETLRMTADESLRKLRECERYIADATWRNQVSETTRRIDRQLQEIPAVNDTVTRQLAERIERSGQRLQQTQDALQQAYALK